MLHTAASTRAAACEIRSQPLEDRGSILFAGLQWLLAGAAMAEWVMLALALGAGLLLGWLLTRRPEQPGVGDQSLNSPPSANTNCSGFRYLRKAAFTCSTVSAAIASSMRCDSAKSRFR